MGIFRCPTCGSTLRIAPRRHGKTREVGHVKSMWCWKCKRLRGFEMLGKERR